MNSLTIASFGYIAGSEPSGISGSGSIILSNLYITGTNIDYIPSGRLFYIEGLLLSESEIGGLLDG